MRPGHRPLTVLGTLALPVLLAGCITVTAPQPVETRLPPGFDGQSLSPASPSSATPVASVFPEQPDDGATATPSSSVSDTPTPPGTDAVDCADGGDRSVSGADRSFRITGPCNELAVSGSALTVDASTASVTTLRISGDRIRVQVADADTVIVQGNDGVVVSAAGVGRLDVSGDRTTTEATSGISSVTVRGQDNLVRSGGGIGSVVVEGSGNDIR